MPYVVALLVSLLLTPVVRRALWRSNLLDTPSARSLHAIPTPRGGGIAPVVALLVALALGASREEHVWVVGGCVLAFALVGLVDDVKSVPAAHRLAAQGVIAAAAVTGLGIDDRATWVVVIVAIVWTVAFVNVFNFMDGANGVASVQVIVAGAVWFLLARDADAELMQVSAGGACLAALGFLPQNFPKARVFLGDVGSYGLGGLLGLLVIVGWQEEISVVALMGPLWIFLIDSAITLARRILRRERILEAHRQHVYQRLVAVGWSHAHVTVSVLVLSLAAAIAGALTTYGPRSLVVAWVGLAGIAAIYLLLPRLTWRSR